MRNSRYSFRGRKFPSLSLRARMLEERCRWLAEENRRLYNQAMTDSLTGLPNRRYLQQLLSSPSAYSGEENLAGMMIDIDYFKQYNDCYGHLAGDRYLRRLSGLLKNFLKRRRGFAVRYGGEEFFLCLLGCSPRQALEDAEALRSVIAHDIARPGARQADHLKKPPDLTVSIGVCCGKAGGTSRLYVLLRNADRALYQAKAKGRNRIEMWK